MTPRFGFSRFGPATGGTINDDGGKFSDKDRMVLDSILSAFENHTHSDLDAGGKLADPPGTPTAMYSNAGGTLAGGKTYHYAVTFIDQHGLETAPSASAAVTAPAPVMTPRAPQVYASTGGSLEAGMYYYILTAIGPDGVETTPSAPVPVTLLPGDASVRIIPPAPPAGTSVVQYRAWRQYQTANGFTRLAPFAPGEEYVDDGSIPNEPCACDPANMPPQVNMSSSAGSVTVTLTTEQLTAVNNDVYRARGWRLYRTDVEGAWSGQCLVAEVTTTVNDDGTGGFVPAVVDRGASLAYGAPPEKSQVLAGGKPLLTTSVQWHQPLPAQGRPGATVVSGDFSYVRTLDGKWVQAGTPILSEDPADGRIGEVYFSSTANEFRKYDGSSWVAVVASGSGGGSGGGGGGGGGGGTTDGIGIVDKTSTGITMDDPYPRFYNVGPFLFFKSGVSQHIEGFGGVTQVGVPKFPNDFDLGRYGKVPQGTLVEVNDGFRKVRNSSDSGILWDFI